MIRKLSTFIVITLMFLLCGCAKTKTTLPTVDYNITYHLDGGLNNDNPLTYNLNMGTVKLKSPEKSSCTFKGWYKDEAYENPISSLDKSINEDIDLYAKWVYGIVEKEYIFNIGIGKRYTLFQISDTHVNAGTSTEDQMKEQARLNESRISYANKFGERYDNNYICKESKQGFIDLVDYANNENPYAVIYSGDIMDFYSEENYDFIKKEIAKTNAPFVYAMGNHETPVNKYIEMPGVKDASFSVLEFDDFEIVTLDNSQGQFTSSQYDKLLDETKKNKPIIIVQHVPLLTKYNETSPISSCSKYYYIDGTETAVNKKMVDLITGNENIRLVLSGHIHGSTESEIVPGKYQLTCSSGLMGNINRITVR